MALREELAASVDEARWEWMRAHLERGGLIVVAADLDLAWAGERVAADDAATVGGWIESGKLAKPSTEQIAAWDAASDKRFRMLIVSPYILVQEME
ncbi:DUF2288 domain-containing protein [Geobacter sp. DSM 9736]|uniref:DUF2288 domain-containing protein n=1 Tax=Geobacter sp. DSM 9736 TaxID=1277350 RepID=UPI000B50D70A|nr:DUF2288 domain-containing protein [Geobacter sp. DSM 9736]SNB47371.1 hypothetical protein SAMN06269301_2852 [Geobacter sp. DSM 9736]